MSRGQKLTKAEKRERRRTAEPNSPAMASGAAPLMPVVADLGSAALTADTAVSICMSRFDDLVNDATVARIAREVWKNRPGPAAPLAAHLAELADELHRHRDRLRELCDRFAQIADSDEDLPELSDAELGAALERVIGDKPPATDSPVDPEAR